MIEEEGKGQIREVEILYEEEGKSNEMAGESEGECAR